MLSASRRGGSGVSASLVDGREVREVLAEPVGGLVVPRPDEPREVVRVVGLPGRGQTERRRKQFLGGLVEALLLAARVGREPGGKGGFHRVESQRGGHGRSFRSERRFNPESRCVDSRGESCQYASQ